MEPVVYNNAIVEKHSAYSKARSTLQSVSEKDYGNTYQFDPEIKCIDGDKFIGDKLKSVDAIIGISDYKSNRCENPHLLLVELRMDYESGKTLSKSALEQKVFHSKNFLGAELPINNYSVFVFNDQVINQAKRRFSDWSKEGGGIRYCKAYSVTEFNNGILSVDKMPYTYIYEPADVEHSLMIHIEADEWELFINKIFDYWVKIVEDLQFHNNLTEAQSICNVLRKVWRTVTIKKPEMDSDTLWMIEATEEDYGKYLK